MSHYESLEHNESDSDGECASESAEESQRSPGLRFEEHVEDGVGDSAGGEADKVISRHLGTRIRTRVHQSQRQKDENVLQVVQLRSTNTLHIIILAKATNKLYRYTTDPL